MNRRVVVVGAGAAGLMAAGKAAENGASVILLEKNDRIAKKLLLTGNGRCNLTNATSPQTFTDHLGPNGAFMRNALARFGAHELRSFLSAHGVRTIVEEEGRVFPASAKAGDVVNALWEYCRASGVRLMPAMQARDLIIDSGAVRGVLCANQQHLNAEAVILATGGASWPGTGSTGDGYRMLERAGHTVNPLFPGLVPLVAAEPWMGKLEGLSFHEVRVSLKTGPKQTITRAGGLLFTRDGISGPVILNLSVLLSPLLAFHVVTLYLDFLPGFSMQALDTRLKEDFAQAGNSELATALQAYVPRRFAHLVCDLAVSDGKQNASDSGDTRASQVNDRQRARLVGMLKRFTVTITGTRPIREAYVTVGGVSCAEIDPVSFASRRLTGLYVTGELLDVAGETGGFNLQTAFTSGWLAGLAAAG